MAEFNSISLSPTILTFLFTDLEGSTRLWQRFPEAMETVLARHDEIIRTTVEDFDGFVVKTTGDGFYAAFTSPLNALQACIQAQQSLAEEDWGETGPLMVRMGLHIGEAQQRGGDYFGTTINRTARLMSAANGGQVLLSAAVVELVSHQLPENASLQDLGEHRLKDLNRPEHIFQLIHPKLPADFPPIASLNRLPNNLPSQPTVFIGRQVELDEIRSLLLDKTVRLLTLIGPGGTGKTRLALQLGAELMDGFMDGTYFIDLAPIRDPNSFLTTIARTIRLSESSDGSLLDDLKEQLADKSMLLLLDNFEQITAAATLVVTLLQYCPRLKLLVTSREALHVRGEHLYPVPPLGLPEVSDGHISREALTQYESIQLFVERAQAVRPDFELTDDNKEAVVELCLRLDGLPLAIELATARLRVFSPQALRQRLGNRLKLLQGGPRDLPERQQTLRDTIEWSYEMLSEHEKRLFEVVSVFSSCTFEAVEAVVSGIKILVENEVDVIEGLISLVDKSLIHQSDDALGEPQLKMLETIREYAVDRLNGDLDLHTATCQAHAAYFADFTEQQWQRMMGSEREAAMEQMAANVENLNAAWFFWSEQRDLEHLQKMVNGLWLLYDRKGWYQATIELTKDLLEILSTTPTSPDQVQQEILLQTSLARALLATKGYTPEAEAAYNRALKLSEGQGEIPQLFPVLRGLSSYYTYRAEFEKGLQIGKRILELAENNDDDYLRMHGYLVLGASTGFQISLQEGLKLLDKGIALFERELHILRPYQLGNHPGIVCYTSSAFFLWFLGYPDRAVAQADKAIEMATKLNHPFTMAYALFHTGILHLWRGEIVKASERAQAMLVLAHEHGFQIWESLATLLIGVTQVMLGKPDEGLRNIEQGFTHYQGLKSPPVFYPMLIGMRAGALAQANKPVEGLTIMEGFLADFDEKLMLQNAPQMLLVKVDLLLAVSPEKTAEAIRILKNILVNAGQMGGRILALQATTRLCRLEMTKDQFEVNYQDLREIYDSFTEGFDVVDLQIARSILEGQRE